MEKRDGARSCMCRHGSPALRTIAARLSDTQGNLIISGCDCQWGDGIFRWSGHAFCKNSSGNPQENLLPELRNIGWHELTADYYRKLITLGMCGWRLRPIRNMPVSPHTLGQSLFGIQQNIFQWIIKGTAEVAFNNYQTAKVLQQKVNVSG